LPIMVAAGLAVGVCGGLILVLGTGKSDAATNVAGPSGEEGAGGMDAGAPDGLTEVAEVPVDAAPAKPAVKKVTLSFEVDPGAAKITVDGEEIEGDTYELELKDGETRKVTIAAEAKGYKSKTMKQTISDDETIEIELQKEKTQTRSSGGSRKGSRRGGSKGGPKKGGLIDL
jgi:hypothetical protein